MIRAPSSAFTLDIASLTLLVMSVCSAPLRCMKEANCIGLMADQCTGASGSDTLRLYLSITVVVLSTNSVCQLCHLGGVFAGGEDEGGLCVFQHMLHLPARLQGTV